MALTLLAMFQEEWESVGHERSFFELVPDVAHIAAWLALAAFVLLVLVALIRRGRYRALEVLKEADLATLRAAITVAESRSHGEIAVVILERSDRHPAAEWIAGLATTVVGSAAFAAWLPWDQPALLMLSQLLLGALGFGCARLLPDFKRRFVSALRADEMCSEQALQEFHLQGLHRTAEGTGVLILVSLFEHRVIVLGDQGIDARVPAEHWTATSDAILSGVRAGELARGVADGIGRCGEVLAEHFPREGADLDEVPDHVIVRRE